MLSSGWYDLMFVLSAVLFNLLIAGIFVAWKHGKGNLVKRLGSLVYLYRGGKRYKAGTM